MPRPRPAREDPMSTATVVEPASTLAPDQAPPPRRTCTLDDLLRDPDGVRYELVDGQLVELHLSTEANAIAGEVFGLLWTHCRATGQARAFQEHGYACFPGDKKKMRRPDVSLVLTERMTPPLFRE